MHVWSLPKVFHTCGKNCGNSSRSVPLLGFWLEFSRILWGAKAAEAREIGFFGRSLMMKGRKMALSPGRSSVEADFSE
jgi:hypothetical protein